MLTRRHIRIKVMQSVYAYNQSINRELETQEKFLNYSIEQMSDLYSLLLRLIVSVRDQAQEYMERSSQKFLATDVPRTPRNGLPAMERSCSRGLLHAPDGHRAALVSP